MRTWRGLGQWLVATSLTESPRCPEHFGDHSLGTRAGSSMALCHSEAGVSLTQIAPMICVFGKYVEDLGTRNQERIHRG